MKKNWMLIVGILFLIGALGSSAEAPTFSVVIGLILGVVLILLWIKKRKASKAENASTQMPIAPPVPQKSRMTQTDEETDGVQSDNSNKIKRYKVAGTTYYKPAFEKLAVENPDYMLSKKELIEEDLTDTFIYQYNFYPKQVDLVPEPDNPYDPNAIKVIVDGEHIGHIKKGNCAHLLKVINGGRIESISAVLYGGKYKYITSYDDDDKTTYQIETDASEYGAKVEIIEKPE